MYHDCSQFPQVVNFSSVKKLMQVVKINKVSYTTQPQPTAIVPLFRISFTFIEGLQLFRHGYDSSSDKTKSKERA